MGVLNGLIAHHDAQLTLLLIVALQHFGRSMVDLQTMQNSCRFVILTGGHFAAAVVTDTFGFGRIADDVVAGAASGADTAAGHTADDFIVADLQGNNMVDSYTLCIQNFRLDQGAGHPVQNEAVFAIGLGNPLRNDGKTMILTSGILSPPY